MAPAANGDSQSSGHNVSLLIDGESVQSGSKFPVINPADGSSVWTYSSATVEDAQRAVESAAAAFPAWAKTSAVERSEILRKAASLYAERKDQLAEYMKLETAADDGFIGFNIEATAKQLQDVANRATAIQGSFPQLEDDSRSALVLREPYGVILGIAPWNAPYILGTRSVAAALVTGNTAILKGSEMSPRCFRAIVDIFHDSGLPKGCLNLVFAAPENAVQVTEALIKHPAIGKVNFTGSTMVGGSVAAMAGKYLKPVLLELGGKASAIVCDDADLKKAATFCLLGAFIHSGQVCMGTERIIVHSSIAKAFEEELKNTMGTLHPESGAGPTVISSKSKSRVQGLISDAISKGASPICGEDPGKQDKLQRTVLAKVAPGMDLYYTESFGPVASFHVFETEDEALALANDTDYGLAGAIFTENLAKGLRMAKKYTTGAVHINSMSIHDEAALPHGGVKSSGFGRFNSDQGLNEFLRTKVITWEN